MLLTSQTFAVSTGNADKWSSVKASRNTSSSAVRNLCQLNLIVDE
jgi:hypothetical protein